MAKPTPSSTSNKTFNKLKLCKKVNVEQEFGSLKQRFQNFQVFMILLYVELLEVGDGDPFTSKDFAKIYGLYVEGMSAKWTKVSAWWGGPKTIGIYKFKSLFPLYLF
jgi:hypothetical protein